MAACLKWRVQHFGKFAFLQRSSLYKTNLNSTGALTIAGWQRVTPKVVFLTNKCLVVAQPVSCVALERHRGADGQIVAQPDAIYWDTRVHTGVGVQGDN